jgi:histidinol-phosphate aminotransferase
MLKIPYETQPLDESFHIVKEDYMKENGGIIFPNPNAPTGVLEDMSVIEEIVAKNPASVVIVDEAYVDFGGKSAISLLEKYDNLLVVQTYSKSRSMAGMRIGFAIGNKELIKYLNDVKYSFNSYTMNDTSIRFGVAAIEDKDYFEETVEKIIATREWTKKKLANLGFTFPDSQANFIFATHESIPAEELQQALRKEKIIVRYFKKPRIDNYLRITVGTQKEMETLIQTLSSYIGNRK